MPLADAGEIVGDDHGPHHRGDVDQLAGGRLQFVIGKEFVRGAEVHGLGGDLFDPAA